MPSWRWTLMPGLVSAALLVGLGEAVRLRRLRHGAPMPHLTRWYFLSAVGGAMVQGELSGWVRVVVVGIAVAALLVSVASAIADGPAPRVTAATVAILGLLLGIVGDAPAASPPTDAIAAGLEQAGDWLFVGLGVALGALGVVSLGLWALRRWEVACVVVRAGTATATDVVE